MLRVKSDKSDWFWSQSIVFTNPFKTRMSLELARGRDSWCWPKGARPLGTRMCNQHLAPPCFQWFQLPAISWAHGRNCFRFLRGFWKASYWRHVRRKCYVKSPNQESYLFDKNTASTTCHFNAFTHRIWFLRSFRSRNCRNIFMQKIALNTFRFCVLPSRKNFLTLIIWRPHFPSGDHENISVASWRLPNQSYFGPCVA